MQGEICSPLMRSLFLNYIELHLEADTNEDIIINRLSIYLVLFSDDAVLISLSSKGFQCSLDNLIEYRNKWNIKGRQDNNPLEILNNW